LIARQLLALLGSCYGRQESMGTLYDPFEGDYVNEMVVRHESARVFDVCMSCQKCLDACSVFPLLVTSVENCLDREAALLTPAQQDGIVNLCHQCAQCISQCPHAEDPLGQAVHFPEMVIRHRAMLRQNNFLTLRQKLFEEILSRSATFMLWKKPFRFLGAQLLRLVTTDVSALPSPQHRVARKENFPLADAPKSSDVSFFPTCVIDTYAPQVGVAMKEVLAQSGVRCVDGDTFTCCGAPDLYSGNITRFKRTVAKNMRSFRQSIEQGRRIVVGQPGCLEVMREHYVAFSDDPHAVDVVRHLQDSWKCVADAQVHHEGGNAPPHTSLGSLVVLQSSMTVHSADTYGPSEVLRRRGFSVQLIEHVALAETVWELHKERIDAMSHSLAQVCDLVEAVGEGEIVSESCLTNLLIAQRTDRRVRHPFEVLAETK
jgi:Fe-S oxidoreductase